MNNSLQNMDATIIKSIVKDLRKKIIPSKFEKAQQPEQNTIQIGLRTLKGLIWLEICWEADLPRFVEIDSPKRNGDQSTLAQQITYGLKGLTLSNIKQEGYERIINLIFADNPEGETKKEIVLEIMGRHSNIFLLDPKKKIITLGKQIKNSSSRFRPLTTGDLYISPPPLKGETPSKHESFQDWKKNICLLPIPLKKALIESYQGISPSLALQLIDDNYNKASNILKLNVSDIDIDTWQKIYKRWLKWIESIDSQEANLYLTGPTDYRVWTFKPEKESEQNLSLSIGNYYQDNIIKIKLKNKIKQVTQNIKKIHDNEISNIIKQKKLLLEASLNNSFKEKADEILCGQNLSKINIDEAQKLYKKSKKLRRSTTAIKERINHHKKNIFKLEECFSFLESIKECAWENNIDKYENLIDLEKEFDNYIFKANKKKPTKEKKIKSNHLELKTKRGLTIQIGRNYKQNEFISIVKARKGDLWFHAQECPGSHVVLKSSITFECQEDIQISADFAALFSKAKGNKSVPIIITLTENLKRVQGSIPGTVIHTKGNVIWGEPERALKYLQANKSQ